MLPALHPAARPLPAEAEPWGPSLHCAPHLQLPGNHGLLRVSRLLIEAHQRPRSRGGHDHSLPSFLALGGRASAGLGTDQPLRLQGGSRTRHVSGRSSGEAGDSISGRTGVRHRARRGPPPPVGAGNVPSLGTRPLSEQACFLHSRDGSWVGDRRVLLSGCCLSSAVLEGSTCVVSRASQQSSKTWKPDPHFTDGETRLPEITQGQVTVPVGVSPELRKAVLDGASSL